MSNRGWLPDEVDRLVNAYKVRNWNGVYATIERMLDLEANGAAVLTREEAAQCAAALSTEDGIWGLDPKNHALMERLRG